MSPTWLEIAVAILLLWVAWRIALLLTPWVIARWRGRRRRDDAAVEARKLPAYTEKGEHHGS